MSIVIAKVSRTCYDGIMPYALLNSSVSRWLQKEDAGEDKSRTATGRKFQVVGPQTAKLRDQQRDSRERGIIKTNADVYVRSSPIPEYTELSDKMVQHDEYTC